LGASQKSSLKDNSLIGIEPEEENIDADEGEQILDCVDSSSPDPFDVFEMAEEDDFEEKPGASDTRIPSPKPFRQSRNDLKSMGAPLLRRSVEFVQ